MLEMNPWLFAVFLFTAFLFGVATCYVLSVSKLSSTVADSYWYLLEVLKNTEDSHSNTNTLLDDTKHIQDKMDRVNKTITLEHAVGLLLMDDTWEIDTHFDDISGQTVAYVDQTGLPADNGFVIELDEESSYTVIVPKRVLVALRRVLKTRANQQEISNFPYSMRLFKSDVERPPIPPIAATTENAKMHILNPALVAAAQQHMEPKS